MHLSVACLLLYPPHSPSQRAVAPATRPPVSKPKGRTPKGADGTPCDWDERDGCWRESDGTPFDPKRAAARKKTRQREAQSEASKRAERNTNAAAHRKTRGVTPLKQALMLPPGPREMQMLFDTHGSGSAVFTVNSRRLRALPEGSDLHAVCVEDTAKDLKRLCPVDVLDQYRMVKAFVERKEQAELLRVCGTCGVCDPSMWYCEPIKLCLLYTSPSPRDLSTSRMPSSA